MLDPKVVDLANDRIRLEIAEQNKRVSEDISRINSEMAMRGTLRSGGTIKRITSLCSDATKDRAQMAWTTLFRFLTTGGIKYHDGLAEELKRIVTEHLPESLDDLKGRVKGIVEHIGIANLDSQMLQMVEDARIAALSKINGEIDLFVISLREREKMSNEKSDQTVVNMNIYSPVGAIQTGANAIAYPTQYLDTGTQERLLNELKKVEEALVNSDSLPSQPKSEIVELVQESQVEIQKEKPNTTKVRTLLSTVGESIRTVGSLKPAYEILKTVLTYFGVNLP